MTNLTPRKNLAEKRASVLEKTVFGQVSSILHLDKRAVQSDMDIVQCIRKGLPFKIVEDVCKELCLTQQDLSKSLGFNVRTLARRKRERKLHPEESDRIYRLVRIYALATEILEDKKFAIQWLNTPKTALNSEIPLRLLDTEAGAREVERLLGRVEYSVFT